MLAAGVVTNTSNRSADSPYHESLTCQFPASHVPIASESVCTTTLYKVYSTTAEVLVTTLSLRQLAKTAVLDQVFVPGTKDSILDSGAMAPLIEGTQGTGARVRLVGVAIARIITSIAAANDLELHSIDIEQSFLQADKLMEGVEIPRRQEPCIRPWMPFSRAKVLIP